MSKVYLEDSTLTSIANAIRAKTGGSSQITPANMPTEIGSISSGGVNINWGSLDSYTELNPSGMFSSIIPNSITWEKTNCAIPALSFLPMGTNFKWKTTGKNTVTESAKIINTLTDQIPFISMFYDPDTTGTKSTTLLSKLDLSEFNNTNWKNTYISSSSSYPQTGMANKLSSIWRTAGCVYTGEVPQHIIDSIQGLWTKSESNQNTNNIGYWQPYTTPILYIAGLRDLGYFYPRFFDHNIRFTDITPLVNIIRKPTGMTQTHLENRHGYYATLFKDYWFDTREVIKMNNLQVINDINVTTNMFADTNQGIGYSAIMQWMPKIKEISFELDSNNQPIVANWKNQIIYLYSYSSNPGYSFDYMKLFNTLPDVSAYGEGTNKLTFCNANGTFNNDTPPTAAEIAVAAAKGWTVTIQ